MSGQVIIIDPVTRVEGHLKIKVELDATNTVIGAHVTGNLFRDFENILKDRHPWDAVHITQRICGVCPVSHSITATQAAEQAVGFTPNDQAIMIRAIMQGAYFLADHILHFYHLNLLDYISGPASAPWSPGYTADMRFTASQSERLFNNYVEALKVRRQAQEMVAILGGRMPHVMTIAPGGVTQTPDEHQQHQLKNYITIVKAFVDEKYIPDVESLATVYNDYFKIGKGTENFIGYNAFELPGNNRLFQQGRIVKGEQHHLDILKINEYVKYSYYARGTGLNPTEGETVPEFYKQEAYSWLKAPRYEGEVYETGPLARMKINGYYNGGISVMDRIMARAHETKMICDAIPEWIHNLVPGANAYQDITLPDAGMGIGLTEAPRGSLGHWLQYAGNKITRYQIVTPTCWNASPRDDQGNAGALEQALIGTRVGNVEQPLELLRIVHSFDPCLSCSVHVITPKNSISKEFIVGGIKF